jgi:tetratricopeptide (TPR) repeat protein
MRPFNYGSTKGGFMFYHNTEGIDQSNLQIKTKNEIEKFILESKYDEAINLGQNYLDSLNGNFKENSVFLHTLSKAYYENRQFEEALKIIDLIPSASYNSDVMSLNSMIYIKFGRYKDAIEVSSDGIKNFPNDKSHYILRGEANKHLLNYEAAHQDFKIALSDFLALEETNDAFKILDQLLPAEAGSLVNACKADF